MKGNERVVVLVAAMVLLIAALTGCTSDSTAAGGADDAPTATAPPPTEAPATTVPTATQTPVSNDELIAAAIAQLDTDIAADNGPEGTIAYDLLDTRVDEDGFVTLTICTWTGDTVFTTIRDSLYRTSINDDDTITATHITSPVAPGDCLNTTLINTALDFIDEFDTYWADIVQDPTTFATDPRTDELMTDGYSVTASEFASRWVSDGIYFEPAFEAGDASGTAIADILYRRYRAGETPILEVVVCRDMATSYGSYRNGALVDDQSSPNDAGADAIDAYQITTSTDDPGTLMLAGTDALVWASCSRVADWPAAVGQWRSAESSFAVLES